MAIRPVVYEDGTFTPEQRNELRRIFPQALLVEIMDSYMRTLNANLQRIALESTFIEQRLHEAIANHIRLHTTYKAEFFIIDTEIRALEDEQRGAILALRDQSLPPTINQERPDPDCDLDYVPNHMRKAAIDYALSNSFGFGGTNAALLFKRWANH